MAGPYYGTIKFKNGQQARVYAAASVALGVYMPVETVGDVASTSPTQFRVQSQTDIDDWIADATCTAIVEFVADGVPTGRFLNWSAEHAATAIRPPVRLTLRPGVAYGLIVRKAGAA